MVGSGIIRWLLRNQIKREKTTWLLIPAYPYRAHSGGAHPLPQKNSVAAPPLLQDASFSACTICKAYSFSNQHMHIYIEVACCNYSRKSKKIYISHIKVRIIIRGFS